MDIKGWWDQACEASRCQLLYSTSLHSGLSNDAWTKKFDELDVGLRARMSVRIGMLAEIIKQMNEVRESC